MNVVNADPKVDFDMLLLRYFVTYELVKIPISVFVYIPTIFSHLTSIYIGKFK